MKTWLISEYIIKMKTLPFYLDNGVYIVEMKSVKDKYKKLENTFCMMLKPYQTNLNSFDDLKKPDFEWFKSEDYDSSYNMRFNALLKQANTFYNEYTHYLKSLSNLKIPEKDFQQYLNSKKTSDSITTYQTIKKRFKYALQNFQESYNNISNLLEHSYTPYLSTYNMSDYDKPRNDIYINKSSNKQMILNKHNQFADVSIKTQQFLYPTNDHKFKTLNFNTGYVLSKHTNDKSENLVLIPNFKIEKTNDRFEPKTKIHMDDTITTPLKESDDMVEVLYI